MTHLEPITEQQGELRFRRVPLACRHLPQKRIADLKITGEGVQIVVANRNVCLMKTIPVRKTESGTHLDLASAQLESVSNPNFLVPLRKVWAQRTTK